MIRIEIKQFRCWDRIILDIFPDSITLVKGSSGIGKTTIFQAINWCLYGNIRNVAPLHDDKAKTQVVLIFPRKNLRIERNRNPSRLLLRFGLEDSEDTIAQQFIDATFGSQDMWSSSCYILQGSRNSFISASNNEKIALLNKIAFHDEDPEISINKIDEVKTALEMQIKVRNAAYLEKHKILTKMFEEDNDVLLTEEDIVEINERITELKKNKEEKNKQQNQRNIDLGILSNLRSQMTKYKCEKPTLPEYLSSVEEIDNLLPLFSRLIPKVQYRDKLLKEIAALPDLSDKLGNNNWEELNFKYDANSAIARKYGLSYEKVAVEKAISKFRDILAVQETIKLGREYLDAKRTVEHMENLKKPDPRPTFVPRIIPEVNDNTVELQGEVEKLLSEQGSLQGHLQHLIKNKDIIKCPHCDGSLRYLSSKLVVAGDNPPDETEINQVKSRVESIQAQIFSLNKKIRSIEQEKMGREKALREENQRKLTHDQLIMSIEKEEYQYENRLAEIKKIKEAMNNLVDKMDRLPRNTNCYSLLSEREIREMENKITDLERLELVEKPNISLIDINKYKDRCAKMGQLEETKKEIDNIGLDTDEPSIIYEEMSAFKQKWQKYLSENKIIEDLKQDEERIMGKLLPDQQEEITRIEKKITRNKNMLISHEKAAKVEAYRESLEKEEEELKAMTRRHKNLEKLYNCARDTETKVLEQVVANINESIFEICSHLFDRDIKIEISLFKELKTKKEIRRQVNFTITYDGNKYDGINQLSGGEGDRASLALTIALNRMSGCPILLIDESLASVDITMKELAIKALRDYATSTILLIQHDGVEGIFDHTIDLEKYR